MLWSDPWVTVALSPGGTRLVPPPPRLPNGFTCRLESRDSLHIRAWATLVGTRFHSTEIYRRLQNTVIPCLHDASGSIVATCVFRATDRSGVFLLETLVSRKGYAGHLLHAGIYQFYKRIGPHSLVYTWELTAAQLVGAWLRGWISSMTSMEYGWISRTSNLPGSDSGLDDDFIHVYMGSGLAPRPNKTNKKFWTSWPTCPGPGWSWTGEFVVTGVLNRIHEGPFPRPSQLEIPPAPR